MDRFHSDSEAARNALIAVAVARIMAQVQQAQRNPDLSRGLRESIMRILDQHMPSNLAPQQYISSAFKIQD